MADLIDRQAAIDAINGIDNVVGCEHITEALSDAINAVASIPSAQPEIAKRIAETEQNVSIDDFISRKAAIDEFYKYPNIKWTTLDILNELGSLPSAQPTQNNDANALKALDCVDRPTGTWVYTPTEPLGYTCSVCGKGCCRFNFCPNCGAEMRGEQNDND